MSETPRLMDKISLSRTVPMMILYPLGSSWQGLNPHSRRHSLRSGWRGNRTPPSTTATSQNGIQPSLYVIPSSGPSGLTSTFAGTLYSFLNRLMDSASPSQCLCTPILA